MQTRSRFLATVFASLVVSCAAAQIPAPGEPHPDREQLKLVWSDEFNVAGRPDPKNWTYEQGFVRNQELQWYQAENATCAEGLLVITAQREKRVNPRYREGNHDWRNRPHAEYTSACLITRGLHEWKYGRFEMRAKLDTRKGLWPAFWTLGTTRRWPQSGEIDITEYYRGILLANAFWGKAGGGWTPAESVTRKRIDTFADRDWADSFHLWHMDWTHDAIDIFVDGERLNHVDLDQTFNGDDPKTNPFREPHYLLVNLAIGGTQGGDPSKTDFPATLEVDYIRVWQAEEAK